jgi:hypothetical protein
LKVTIVLAGVVGMGSLALAPVAVARIVPQQGMAGLRLNMTKSEVRDKLGKPRAVKTGKNDFGEYTVYTYRGKLTAFFQSGSKVTSLRTSGRSERTKNGIGVGSTEERVRDEFSKVKCRTLVKSRSCYLGELTPGERVTDFQIRDVKVHGVVIGFVID